MIFGLIMCFPTIHVFRLNEKKVFSDESCFVHFPSEYFACFPFHSKFFKADDDKLQLNGLLCIFSRSNFIFFINYIDEATKKRRRERESYFLYEGNKVFLHHRYLHRSLCRCGPREARNQIRPPSSCLLGSLTSSINFLKVSFELLFFVFSFHENENLRTFARGNFFNVFLHFTR